jgi:hypothetical protein
MASSPSPGGSGQDTSDTQGGIVHYRVKFTSGATGAVPTFPLSMSNRITSVTYSATGIYTIVLGSNFYQLANLQGGIMQASYSAAGACRIRPVSAVGSTGTVVITTEDDDGDAVAASDGDVIYLDIEVQNYKSQ